MAATATTIPAPERPPGEAAAAGKPALPPGTRLINGRLIEREFRGDVILYRSIERPPPVEELVTVPESVAKVRLMRPRPPVVTWQAAIDPAGVMDQLGRSLNLIPFDPREPSPLHDELERAEAAGFSVLVAECVARLRPEPRATLPGFGLGQVGVSTGARKLAPAAGTIREYLKRHATGDHGEHGSSVGIELDSDMRFCPVAFGLDVQNAASIEANRGIVQSLYTVPFGPKARPEELKIVSRIGLGTIIYCPRLDATG